MNFSNFSISKPQKNENRMMLSDLIRGKVKNVLERFPVATPAETRPAGADTGPTVAKVATVAVANPQKRKNDPTSMLPEMQLRGDGTTDPKNILEYIEERAAILEYETQTPRADGKGFDSVVSRCDAEREAVRRAVLKFKLIENQGGGTAIGAQGVTLEDLKAKLAERYGDRLKSIER
ncbi:MAG: hypothetical protein ACRESZ_14515 [Methylococcales bacterium]